MNFTNVARTPALQSPEQVYNQLQQIPVAVESQSSVSTFRSPILQVGCLGVHSIPCDQVLFQLALLFPSPRMRKASTTTHCHRLAQLIVFLQHKEHCLILFQHLPAQYDINKADQSPNLRSRTFRNWPNATICCNFSCLVREFICRICNLPYLKNPGHVHGRYSSPRPGGVR